MSVEPVFYLSVPAECPYLPPRVEQKLLCRLEDATAQETYDRLIRLGFRRSRHWAYRPRCEGCRACTPVRIPVDPWRPSRSQRRILARNAGLTETRAPARLREDLWTLFHRYLATRHGDGEMAAMSRDDFRRLLEDSPISSHLVVWERADGTPAAACLLDEVEDGLSAVYSFFEPTPSRDSLGTYLILRLVERCRVEGRHHLYLGYWVPGAPKMDYKARFRPLEAFGPGGWQRLGNPGPQASRRVTSHDDP